MSKKERGRLEWLPRVQRKEVTLADAAAAMGLCYRQAQRVMKRYVAEQDAGLVHRARGRASPRAFPQAMRDRVVDRYQTHYRGFGPTLGSEYLAERDDLHLSAETLRRWLLKEGIWQVERPAPKHRTRRKRKGHFGEMVQLDGSVHRWFEDRGEACFVMNMVDDATSETHVLFSEQETTQAAMDVLEQWIGKYGVPASLYVDARNVYVSKREPDVEEQLAGQAALTQFGRACRKLGIRIIVAHSPQAKGRVERSNGTLQNRLIKAMRLEGICSIQEANAFVGGWLPGFNQRFAVEAADPADLHRPVPDGLDLRGVLCWEETRCVSNDWTVRFEGEQYHICKQPDLPPRRSKVRVQRWRDGSVHLLQADRELVCRLVEQPAPKAQTTARSRPGTPPRPPAEDHSWRTGKFVPVDTTTPLRQREDLARTYLGLPAVLKG
jgi:molybdenum-dependent DNA-binding transcriptional regulator ModE